MIIICEDYFSDISIDGDHLTRTVKCHHENQGFCQIIQAIEVSVHHLVLMSISG